MKLCKDCKWFIPEKNLSTTPLIVVKNACCCIDVTTMTNVITGEVKKTDYVDAATARIKGMCKIDAIYFKPKNLNIVTSNEVN